MKKFGAFLLAGVLAIGALTGCGSTDKKAESSTGSTDTQVIKVAASATPHAEILEEAKPLLAKEGYDLQVTVFDDYHYIVNRVYRNILRENRTAGTGICY